MWHARPLEDLITVHDVDGDGDQDIVAGNNGQPDVVYHNDGDGTFDTTSTEMGTASGATQAVVLGDVDQNGSVDAVTGDSVGTGSVYISALSHQPNGAIFKFR